MQSSPRMYSDLVEGQKVHKITVPANYWSRAEDQVESYFAHGGRKIVAVFFEGRDYPAYVVTNVAS